MNPTTIRHELDAAGTQAVLDAAVRHAEQAGLRVVVAVVDAFGHVLGLRRTDGAQRASDAVAIDKARTAAIFVRPSREIEQQVTDGRSARSRCTAPPLYPPAPPAPPASVPR